MRRSDLLTRYDEFPVHQCTRPFSEVPITDYTFDDGYFFGLFDPDQKLFLFTGMRVNPNSDIVGGYAGVMLDGLQYTVRFSRVWRPECDTAIGPLRYSFVEAFRDIHLTLEANASELSFDLHWLARSRPYEEEHHVATSRGRRSTDQTRYSQSGTGTGWIEFRGRRFEVRPGTWLGSRDHSWGLYAPRPPLAPDPRWLPPAERPAVRRALRFWSNFGAGDYSGFFHLHESETGEQVPMNDTFGTPFEGGIDWGPEGAHLRLVAGSHELEFREGTRVLTSARIALTDEQGGRWQLFFEPAAPPWNPFTIGYTIGSWRDGGSMYTYHGSDGPVIEYDEFDWSEQPYTLPTYAGFEIPEVAGSEYLCRVTATAPDGSRSTGSAHVELFIEGRFDPYGFGDGRGGAGRA